MVALTHKGGAPVEVEQIGFQTNNSRGRMQANSRRRMLDVQENKRSTKFDEKIVLSNDHMKKQIDGHRPCKLVTKRKQVPNTRLNVWKYIKMRQKDSLFSEPLVQGMCTDLHNTYNDEFPRKSDRNDDAQDHHEAILDLNLIPEAANDDEQDEQEAMLDLNLPPEEAIDDDQDQHEANGDEQDQQEAIDDEQDQQEAIDDEQKRHAVNLTDKQRLAAYFALTVIKSKDGKVEKKDKKLVARLLKTSLSTIDRIWKGAKEQLEKHQKVDVSNKKKGNSGRKKLELNLSRAKAIPLNQRRTIRGLSRSLGVCRSTLHRRFELGEMERHSSKVKSSLSPANKIHILKFCISMLEENWLATDNPFFQQMDNIVHMDEKWFDMSRNNSYYLLPDEPRPLRIVNNVNSIGKVIFLTFVAKPRYGEGGVVTFDGKIGTWAFIEETAALKILKKEIKGQSNKNQ